MRVTNPNSALPVMLLGLLAGLGACSSNQSESSETDAGQSRAGSGGEGDGGRTGSGTGGAASTGGSAQGGAATSDALVGSFLVQLVAPSTTGTPGVTKVVGKVSNGPTPASIVWKTSSSGAGCQLSKPYVPFCDPSCGANVCVADDTCLGYPNSLSVGKVTVTGVRATSGESSFSMNPVAGGYQPVGVTLAYPAFAEGDAVHLEAEGGDATPFSLEAKGIAPLGLTSGDLLLESGKALSLTWTPPENAGSSRIHVKLDVSHHGGSKGKIDCDVDDTGSLDIPAELVTSLLALGVAGFPTVVVSREASASTQIAVGRIALVVSSDVETRVTIPGLESCSADADCTGGKKCKADLTCG